MIGTKVTCEDLESGESETAIIRDNYVVIVDGKMEVSHIQRYKNGTTQITVKAKEDK